MGWFDESDDDDNLPNSKDASCIPSNNNDTVNAGIDDDEDPLDAYMKTLETNVTNNNVCDRSLPVRHSEQDSSYKKYGREEEEEEDDEIQYERYSKDVIYRNPRELLEEGDDDDYGTDHNEHEPPIATYTKTSKVSQHAREALATTFVKAGSTKQHSTTYSSGPNNTNSDEAIDTKRKFSDAFVGNSSSESYTTMSTKQETFEQPEAILYESFQKNFWIGTDTSDGHKWRQNNSVTYTTRRRRGMNSTNKNNNDNNNITPKYIDPIYEFYELRDVFGNDLLIEILKHYSKPTLVQSQTLPVALSGHDAIITAATGQGKTLSYLWPIAVHLANQPPLRSSSLSNDNESSSTLIETGPIALVLVPTRELAIQVEQQARSVLKAILSKEDRQINGVLSSRTVIGGQGKYLLRQEIKKSGGIDLVVATPGRFLDVLSDKKGLSLRRVTFVVLDEADKMLQMGFESDVRRILSNIRTDRQTLMLSATMGHRVEDVASEWLHDDAIRISIGRTGEASHNVTQYAMILPDYNSKVQFLIEMLPTFVQIGRTLIFVATREGCEQLATNLRNQLVNGTGTDVAAVTIQTLHGDKHQMDRTSAVRAFTKGDINTLIATDVAGRGLDIPNVQTVISFDPAKNLDTHVHRVGRAGRLSSSSTDANQQQQQIGSAYTLLTEKNSDFALVLKNSFEREGHEISTDLQRLAMKSHYKKQYGNNNIDSSTSTTRPKWNKSGLGHNTTTATNNNKQVMTKDDPNESWMKRLEQHHTETTSTSQQQQQQQQSK